MNLLLDATLFDEDWQPPEGEYNPDAIERLHNMRKRYFELLPGVLEAARQRKPVKVTPMMCGFPDGPSPFRYEPEPHCEDESDVEYY